MALAHSFNGVEWQFINLKILALIRPAQIRKDFLKMYNASYERLSLVMMTCITYVRKLQNSIENNFEENI